MLGFWKRWKKDEEMMEREERRKSWTKFLP